MLRRHSRCCGVALIKHRSYWKLYPPCFVTEDPSVTHVTPKAPTWNVMILDAGSDCNPSCIRSTCHSRGPTDTVQATGARAICCTFLSLISAGGAYDGGSSRRLVAGTRAAPPAVLLSSRTPYPEGTRPGCCTHARAVTGLREEEISSRTSSPSVILPILDPALYSPEAPRRCRAHRIWALSPTLSPSTAKDEPSRSGRWRYPPMAVPPGALRKAAPSAVVGSMVTPRWTMATGDATKTDAVGRCGGSLA